MRVYFPVDLGCRDEYVIAYRGTVKSDAICCMLRRGQGDLNPHFVEIQTPPRSHAKHDTNRSGKPAVQNSTRASNSGLCDRDGAFVPICVGSAHQEIRAVVVTFISTYNFKIKHTLSNLILSYSVLL